MSKGGTSPGRSNESLDRWRTAGELLKTGQYERVAELLRQAQPASGRTKDALLAHILDAARSICLACCQYRAEAEWHRQGYQGAAQREQELQQQLFSILDLLGQRKVAATWEVLSAAPVAGLGQPERDTPKSAERPSLWQRLWSLLSQGPSLQSPEPEPPITSAEELIPSPADRTETPITPPPMPECVATTVSPTEKERPGEQGPPSLAIYCFGPFRVYQDDQLITDWDSLKARSILKYLAAHQGAPIVRDVLMDVFWPDADPRAARRNLHQAIYSLRQALRRGQTDFQHIVFKNDCYLLNPEVDVWIDSEEFKKHIQAGRRLEAAGRLAGAMAEYGIAEGLYQGDFLEEDLYEDWPRVQREQMRNIYLNAVDRLSEHYVGQTEYTTAIALCRKVLAQDNCYEEAHRRLMQCYLAQGQRHLAVRQYQTCVEALREELDLAPAKETVTLYQRITTAT